MYHIKKIMKIMKENKNSKAFNFEYITVDFERGLLKAITNRFPNVKVKGCVFNLKQAIRRMV